MYCTVQLDLVVVEDVAVGYGYMPVLWYSTLVPWGTDERILNKACVRWPIIHNHCNVVQT